MRTLVIGMSISLILLILWQIFAKKGNRPHVFRYIGICVLSAIIVAVNTFYLKVTWDFAFIFHLIVGSIYFVGLFAIGVSGWLLHKGRISSRGHRWSIYITLFFLCLTALVPRFLR